MNAEPIKYSLPEELPSVYGALADEETDDSRGEFVPLSLEQKISFECHAYQELLASANDLNSRIDSYRDDHAKEYQKLENLSGEVNKAKRLLDQFNNELKKTRRFDLSQLNNPAFAAEFKAKNSLAKEKAKYEQKYQDVLSRRNALDQKLNGPLDDMCYQLNSLLTGCEVQGLAIAKLLNVPSVYTDHADWDDYVRFKISCSYVSDQPVTAFHIFYGGLGVDGEPVADGYDHGHISVNIETGAILYYRKPGEPHGGENWGNYEDVSVRKLKQEIVQMMTKAEAGEDDDESTIERLQSKLQFLPAALRQLLEEGYRLTKLQPTDQQYAVA